MKNILKTIIIGAAIFTYAEGATAAPSARWLSIAISAVAPLDVDASTKVLSARSNGSTLHLILEVDPAQFSDYDISFAKKHLAKKVCENKRLGEFVMDGGTIAPEIIDKNGASIFKSSVSSCL